MSAWCCQWKRVISLLLLPCLGRWMTCAHSSPFRWVQSYRSSNLNIQANALLMLGAEAERGHAEVRTAVSCFSLEKCINYLWPMWICRCSVLCSTLHMQNCFAHVDIDLGRNEKAQQSWKRDCEKAFNLLLRTMSAAFGMVCVTWDISSWHNCQHLPAAHLTPTGMRQ